MGFLREWRVSKASGFEYMTRAQSDLQYFYTCPDSPFFCDDCKKPLGALHIIRTALFKKKGSSYVVACKNCGKLNGRVKGAFADEVDRRWTEKK